MTTAMPDLEETNRFATEMHDRTGAMYGDKPYIFHVREVAAEIAVTYAGTPDYDMAVTGALLHDIIEDTDVTLAELRRRGYPDDVIDIVDHLTHHKTAGEKYMQYVQRCSTNRIARHIKLADNTCNRRHNPEITNPEDRAFKKKRYDRARTILLLAEAADPEPMPNGTGATE